MITKKTAINALLDALPNKSELEIYAPNIPYKKPPKIVSEERNETYVPEMIIKSKSFTHVISVETDKPSEIDDEYLDKARLFAEYAEDNNGKLYIVARSSFISKVKPELKEESRNIDYLTIK